MFQTTDHQTHYETDIILADGTFAGGGYGPTEKSAQYWACRDALARAFRILTGPDAPGGSAWEREQQAIRLAQAACGHAQFLTEDEERGIRATASELGYHTTL